MANLFRNPSFEEGFYEYQGIENLRIPAQWLFWYAPESFPNPIDSAPHSVFRQPEAHVLHKSDIPASEHHLFFWDGDYTWKVFKGSGAIYIRLTQKQNLAAGRYRITANLYPDLVMRYENGEKVPADSIDAGLMRFYTGGPVGGFDTMFPYLERKTYTHEFDASGVMEIGAEWMLPFALVQNGLFTDMWTLERLSDPSPMYDRVFHLYNQDTTTDEEFEQVAAVARPVGNSMGQSADDCFHTAPSLASRTAHVWRPRDWGGPAALEQWVADTYPPVPTIVYHEYENGGGTSPWEDYLLWQRDPRWFARSFGAPSCDQTIGQSGCFITNLAMSQNIYKLRTNATPPSVDQELTPAGYSGCNALWSASKARLGIEVRRVGTSSANAHLARGGLCMAEVQPETLQHFVLVVERTSNDDYLCLDPYYNTFGLVSERYDGIESWRMLTPVSGPPALSKPGTQLGLHLQTEYTGWEEYIEATKPGMVTLFQFEPARRIKELSPNTIVAVRHFLRHQQPYLFAEDKRAAAKHFINLFKSSLIANAEYVDVMLELNEYIATNDIIGIQNGVAWAVAFAQELASMQLPVVPGLLKTAVGNPGEGDQTRMLIPAAEAAVEFGGYLLYHSYWMPDKLDQDWKWHAGRALEIWDKEFRSVNLYPKYLWGELGVVGARNGGFEPAAGWKDPLAYNGDWPRYQTDLLRFEEKIEVWNSRYGNRARGGSIFTTGADFINWLSFQIRTREMESLELALG